MSGWDDVVTTALLGTQRRTLPGDLPAELGRLATTTADPGLAVLDVAAGYHSWRAAGETPAAMPEPPLPPRQTLDLAPDAAQDLLQVLVRRGEAALVERWLRTCVERRLAVAPAAWSALGAMAAAGRGPAPALVGRAVGERGVAFLAQHPRWRRVADEADPGGPETARRLAADWDAVPAGRRFAVLTALGDGLEPDDEEVLERAAAERQADVRELARRLLSRLPGSAWSRWTTARTLDLVEVTGSSGRRRVVVHPPELGPDDRAHGFTDKPPANQRIGRAAVLLRQLLRYADLAAWEEHTRCTPAELLRLVHETAPDWYADMTTGLSQAAVIQRHAGWATALLEARVLLSLLVPLVPEPDLDRLATRWTTDDVELGPVLLKGLADWSPGISGLATSLLASGRLGPGTARSFAVTAAHRVDPASYSLLRDLVAPDQRARTEVLPVLAARTEIVRTFADPTPETR